MDAAPHARFVYSGHDHSVTKTVSQLGRIVILKTTKHKSDGKHCSNLKISHKMTKEKKENFAICIVVKVSMLIGCKCGFIRLF